MVWSIATCNGNLSSQRNIKKIPFDRIQINSISMDQSTIPNSNLKNKKQYKTSNTGINKFLDIQHFKYFGKGP